jgi:hypothetical protein
MHIEFEEGDDADIKHANQSSRFYKEEISTSYQTLQFIKEFNKEGTNY